MEKISIVMLTRNRAKNIKRTIESILKQTFKDFEIIVVDYGGEDNTKEVLDNFKDRRIKYIYVNEKGIWNAPRARNIGIRRAKAELIATIDADMILAPNVLEEVYKDFKKRKKSVLYQIQRIDIQEDGTKDLHYPGVFPGDFQATHRKNWFKVRGFDERMIGYAYEDEDLPIRMRKMGVFQYWMPKKVKIYHQYHKKSLSEEVYINMLKSILNFSYKANYDDWGAIDKKPRISLRLWRIFDVVAITLIIRPLKIIKRRILKINYDQSQYKKDYEELNVK